MNNAFVSAQHASEIFLGTELTDYNGIRLHSISVRICSVLRFSFAKKRFSSGRGSGVLGDVISAVDVRQLSTTYISVIRENARGVLIDGWGIIYQ